MEWTTLCSRLRDPYYLLCCIPVLHVTALPRKNIKMAPYLPFSLRLFRRLTYIILSPFHSRSSVVVDLASPRRLT